MFHNFQNQTQYIIYNINWWYDHPSAKQFSIKRQYLPSHVYIQKTFFNILNKFS